MTSSDPHAAHRQTVPEMDAALPQELRPRSSDADQTGRLQAVAPEQVAEPSHTPSRERGTLVMLRGPTPGAILPVGEPATLIGRGPEADVRVHDPGVSQRHARVLRTDDELCIEDLGSLNGTYVAGARVAGRRALHGGERVQLGGNVLMRFDLHDALEQGVLSELYRSAVRDPLTRAFNRRYLDERLHGELSYAQRHDRDLSLVLLDIDEFKLVNDTHGHRAGDAVLRLLSALLQRILRPEDLLARWGGEELAVVARGLDTRNAAIVAERIRRAVEELRVPWNGDEIAVTVSVGVASMQERGRHTSVERLVSDADLALYRAKNDGRNCCRCFESNEGKH